MLIYICMTAPKNNYKPLELEFLLTAEVVNDVVKGAKIQTLLNVEI